MRWSANLALVICLACGERALGQSKPRARDLGIPFDGKPGAFNAITDVRGVEVGEVTLISGSGKLAVGKGPVRTGVTAILPRGKKSQDQVFAAWFSLNGNGEMTGTTWVEESGFLAGPVMITNTHSVGLVRDSVIAWQVDLGWPAESKFWWSLPVVAETWDGYLNDINGFHVKKHHVYQALDSAAPGRVGEGDVGGGTGMICYEFKGGTGTSSRKLTISGSGYTLGVLVQCNCGSREQLRIAGVPVGREIPGEKVWSQVVRPGGRAPQAGDDMGSIIIVIATDAPLLPTQLKRLARRASMGLARTGSVSTNGSGDIFIAFSTANPGASQPTGLRQIQMLSNDEMGPLFEATVEATEEAIVNALVAAKTMTGIDNHKVEAIPHGRLQEVLKKYNRLAERQ